MTDKEKFLSTARSYIGKNGYYVCKTKLGLDAVYDWCAFSISAIMKDCGFFGKYTGGIHSYASDEGRYGDGKYGTWFLKYAKAVQPGDIITFRYSSLSPFDKYSASHVGIVEAVNGNIITTLEGNVDGWGDNGACNSSFKRKTRYLSSSDVYAFFRPNWQGENKTTTSSGNKTTTTSNTQTAPDIWYQAYAFGRWQPYVKNLSDYAGLENRPIYGIRCKINKGHIRYRVHLIGGGWLPWVTDTEDFAGASKLNKQIDCIQMELIGVDGYTVQYRVSTAKSTSYLHYVKGWNSTNDEGYAGIYGVAIDKL